MTSRTALIEGIPTTIVENDTPLPRQFPTLLSDLFGVTVRDDFTPSGTSITCETWRTHRFRVIREGRHFGRDRILRDLRIQMCADCGAVCVRDISYDRIDGLPPGGRGPSRRNLILGWYSGKRRAGRQFV